MGHVSILLDIMRLDEMGLDEMGMNKFRDTWASHEITKISTPRK